MKRLCSLILTGLLLLGCSKPAPPPDTPPAPTPAPAPTPPPAQAAPKWIDAERSPFAVRGIVEGFFGEPWTHANRLAAFAFMGQVGLNTYVYAPKDDPYQRQDWREPYPEAELNRFRELLELGRKHGINFVYSISPGLEITYSSEADRQALAAKLDQLQGLGIHTFMLSLDDVPEQLSAADAAVYGKDYALAQVELANWLYATERAKEKEFTLWVTQSHYWGLKPDAYLNTYGAKLDPAIPLIWTGPDVISETITARDTDTFAAIIRRKPIIWDNYPVNDYTYVMKKKPRLILGPIAGRDPDLAPHVGGYLLNPMIQAEASFLPLYTAAAYLANPGAYDPDTAWQAAASRLAVNAEGGETLLEFARFARLSILYDTDAPDLARAIAAYQPGSAEAAPGLRQQFEAMISLPGRLKAVVTDGFFEEVAPWAETLREQGRAGLLALELDAAATQKNTATVEELRPRLSAALADLEARQAKTYIGGNLVETFVRGALERASQ